MSCSSVSKFCMCVHSDNNGNMSDSSVRRSIPVQFAVDLAISL